MWTWSAHGQSLANVLVTNWIWYIYIYIYIYVYTLLFNIYLFIFILLDFSTVRRQFRTINGSYATESLLLSILKKAKRRRRAKQVRRGAFYFAAFTDLSYAITEAFSVNCLRSLRAFAGCFLELNDVYWELRSTNVFLKVFLGWKWVYCSLAVARERTVFPFVKQYIEDKMAAECSYHLTFRAHFLSRRKRSVW